MRHCADIHECFKGRFGANIDMDMSAHSKVIWEPARPPDAASVQTQSEGIRLGADPVPWNVWNGGMWVAVALCMVLPSARQRVAHNAKQRWAHNVHHAQGRRPPLLSNA